MEKTLPEEDLRKLYYYCDAFVYPSLGEGFGFPPRNAVATGLPTLVTSWSALQEIPGAIKVPIQAMVPMPSCGFSYGQEKELHMALIDETKLMYEMYHLATDEDYYNTVAKKVYNIKQKTWEDCAKEFVGMIERYA
jgi:glycosyltransferase involved in cell wall biosynthesis